MPQTLPVAPGRLRPPLVVLVVTSLLAVLPAATSAPAEAAVDHRLQTKLTSVLSDSRSKRAKTGAVVLDAQTGEALYSRYGTRAVLPASNTKIITAVAAMHTLGPDFQFHTDVLRRAEVVDGVLMGRLYLKGYGDPTTRQADFARLADEVAAAGIKKVTGRLIVDSSYFDSQRYNPGWSTSYASDYYAAQTSALTVSPNADYDSGTVFLNYSPASRTGAKAKIITTPAAAIHYVKIVNHTSTSARGGSTTISAHRRYGTNTITVSGRVPRGRSTGHRQITVNKPELYAGAVFRAELAKRKITVVGSTAIMATPATGRILLGTDRSMTLANLLVPFLKLSNNLHAEALTKTMGRAQGRPGNWKDGIAVSLGYLRTLGVPMAGVTLTDGSGVSRRDRLTPRALATTLVKVKQEDWWPSFYAALPVAGDTRRMVGGTLRYRMNGTKAAENARGKTGTLTGVTALSGYVTDRDGRQYVYSMLSNYHGSTPRPVENTFVVALAKWKA
jgi:D-alanyl-D-alanine carboxypeptidase/D-alanyl-D-alanine-endopeptidase (penicillin-binding protein 4)